MRTDTKVGSAASTHCVAKNRQTGKSGSKLSNFRVQLFGRLLECVVQASCRTSEPASFQGIGEIPHAFEILCRLALSKNKSRRQTGCRPDNDEMQSQGHADRLDLFAATSANGCRGACEKERHIASELRGQSLKLCLRQLQLPEPIESDQRRGCVA